MVSHPLDPVCVAILLCLADRASSCEEIAQALRVEPAIVVSRLERLRALGAVMLVDGAGTFRLDPNAHRTVLDVAERNSTSGERPLARCADSVSRRLALFQQDQVLRELPYEELVWLAGVSRTQELAVGEVVFLEGEDCRGLYIVESGLIRLSKWSTSSTAGFGREHTIRLMAPGDSFNEVPVFDHGPNPVTAEAVDDSRVILVPKSELQRILLRSPIFASAVVGIMSKRLRHMLAMIEDVSMRDVRGRVAKILLQSSHPSEGVGAGLVNGRRLTQREIAEMAGTAREVVARVLKKMEQTGAISVNRGNVRILDAELLESFM